MNETVNKAMPEVTPETSRRLTRRSNEVRRSSRFVLAAVLGVLFIWDSAGVDAGVTSSAGSARKRVCQKVILRGEVAEGKEWRAAIGEGWVFRVIPIDSRAARPVGKSYSGWDLVMDRENGEGYPDALLLATPPYGSVNEREIGTSFGMRAQDAIAWEPRSFRFFTNTDSVRRAKTLYGQIFAVEPDKSISQSAAKASLELLNLITHDPKMGSGQFSITDAHLVAGAGDPPAFASQWLAHLGQVPHTLEQSSTGALPHVYSSQTGELRWIQFVATLWLPGGWKMPPGALSESANCAE